MQCKDTGEQYSSDVYEMKLDGRSSLSWDLLEREIRAENLTYPVSNGNCPEFWYNDEGIHELTKDTFQPGDTILVDVKRRNHGNLPT